MRKIKLLYRCINYYGFLYGIPLFAKIVLNKLSKIFLPRYKHSIALRKNTTDLEMFYQVFFNQCYSYSLDFDVNVIVDAGANIGLASIFYSEKYSNASIFSIEPQKDNYAQLIFNSRYYPNIHPINAALFNSEFDFLSIQNIGLGESGFVMSKDDLQKEIVKVVTINSLMKEYSIDCIDILKIDIEGSEYELFAESQYESWLPYVKCVIIELHDNIKPGSSMRFMKAISSYDFRFDMRGENLIFINCNPKSLKIA